VRRVLVTGARGFLGGHVLPMLVPAGALETHATTSRESSTGPLGVGWHHIDLLDSGVVTDFIRRVRPSHLLHLAWVTTPGQFWASDYNARWLAASEALLRTFAESGGERVVVAGSCAEYDWASTGGVCDEARTPVKPKTPYGQAKNSLRLRLQELAEQSSFSWAWGRIFWLYGPGEPSERLVPSVARAVLEGRPALCTSGTQRRDFIYVEDAAQILVDLLNTPLATGAFNVGSGVATAVGDLALAVGSAAGRPDLVRLGALDTQEEGAPLVVADMRRARGGLPRRPPTSTQAGAAQSLDWWQRRLSSRP